MVFPLTAASDKIKHLVILMMENRSFDHYFGALSLDADYKKRVPVPAGGTPVNGIPSPPPAVQDAAGKPVQMWNMDVPDGANGYPQVLTMGYPDLPHGPGPQGLNYVDKAGNNLQAFVTNYQAQMKADNQLPAAQQNTFRRIPMGYYTRKTLPVLYALADNFAVCDRWFSSMLSSTWPNRKYFHCGRRDGDDDTQNLPPLSGFGNTPLWNVLEDQRDQFGNHYTWKNYFSDIPFLLGWFKFAAFHAFGHFTSIDNFVKDCQADQLPTVSILDPAFSLCDDHPTHNVQLGQKFIGLVVDALTRSEAWEDTALLITYDENGGFYDHVLPPQPCNAAAQDAPLGFRVPTLVISPYTPAGVCHTEFDHTTLLKSICVWLGLDTDLFRAADYGTRFVCANDIWSSGCFDFTMAPRPQGIYTEAPGSPAPLSGLTWEHGIDQLMTSPQGDLEAVMERMFLLPGLKLLDHRNQVFDHLNAMESSVVTLKRMQT